MIKYSWIERILFPPTTINQEKLLKELSGKTILITGASSGIGEQLAYYLGEIPCHLILVARRKERLLAIQQAIQTAKVSIFDADLRDSQQMKQFLAFLQVNMNRLDIFVHNAGLSIKRSIFESLHRFHDFQRTMAINYFVPVEILLSIIPLLEKSKGQIINVSTINTLMIPVPFFAAYQASKQAFDTWLQSAAPELHAKGIVTTSVYLPLVRTPMIEPTAMYKNMPAMHPEHVAKKISKAMYTRVLRIQPWWMFTGRIASLLFRSIWESHGKRFVNSRKYK